MTSRLNRKALAGAVGAKRATMGDPVLAERRTGYVVGGISPVGQEMTHTTVFHETAELQDTIVVSRGRRGFDIELAPGDLIRITRCDRCLESRQQAISRLPTASWRC